MFNRHFYFVSFFIYAESRYNSEPSVAQASPSGLAIAGPGGVASSQPSATAVTGDGGISLASPKATAIAGDFFDFDEKKRVKPDKNWERWL